MHCASVWTIKEKNAFKNQNGVTVVQAPKMEVGGHGGCGFRHVPVLLWTWIFWTVSDSRTSPAVLKTISASRCQLQPHSLKVYPCNYAIISDPNPCLISTLTSCRLQSYFLTNDLYNFVGFTFIIFPAFCSLAEHNSSTSWICAIWF